jgi:hypothetical protein
VCRFSRRSLAGSTIFPYFAHNKLPTIEHCPRKRFKNGGAAFLALAALLAVMTYDVHEMLGQFRHA